MNELTTNMFENKKVRVVVEDEETLFVGKDVCAILGFKDANSAMKRHCRGALKRHPIYDTLGRKQDARVIVLDDIVRLVCHSTLPEAERFEKWAIEVVVTVMKTGSYTIPGHERKIELAPEARISKEIDDLKKEKISIEDAYQKLQEINWKIARKELEWCIAHIPDWKLEGLLIHVQREFPDSVRKEVVPVVPELEDGGEA